MAMSRGEMMRQLLNNSTNPNAINGPRAEMQELQDKNSAMSAAPRRGNAAKMEMNLQEMRKIKAQYGKKLLSDK